MIRICLYSSLTLWLLASLMMLTASVASAGDADAEQALDCVINPSVVADLGSGVPGILSRINVDRSDFVEAGEVIAELESGVESASLELARARAALTAEVDLRQVNAAFGQRQKKRTKNLFQRKAISTNDMDERETEARLSQLQLRQARDNQDLAMLERLRAEEILKRRTIKSPIAGVVMERFKVVGEYVEDQPVARVAQIDPLHVEVIVPIEKLGMVRDGMHAEVWSEAVQDKRWQAVVERVDRVADVASGTYGARLTLPNPGYQIPAGLRCRMQLVEKPPVPMEKTSAEVIQKAPVETPTLAARASKPEPVADTAVVPEDREAAQGVVSGDATKNLTATVAPVDPPKVVKQTATKKPVNSLPAGFKAIRRPPAGNTVAVRDEPQGVTEVKPPVVTPEPLQEAVEKAAVAATVMDTPAEIDADQLEADLIADEEEAGEVDLIGDTEPRRSVAAVESLPECRLAGPYSDEVKATKKVVALRRAGLSVDIKSMPSSKSIGYMVASPVLKNRAEGKALIAKLQAAGVTDFYLPRRSPEPLRLSLGLYKGPKRANQQIRKLANKGFTAEMLPWKQRGSQYFLVVRGVRTGENSKLLATLPVPKGKSDSTQGFCNQLAGG